MTPRERLIKDLEICDTHANRLELALRRTEHLWPMSTQRLSDVSETDLGFLELMTNRFAKLQDALGQKIFPALLIELREDVAHRPFIDKLNLLERLGVIPSAQFWMDLREIRNTMAHEYPDDPEGTVVGLNAGHQAARELLDLYVEVKQYIAAHV